MDFLFGPLNTDKTTCLIHLANQFIIEKDIKLNNGYILLFTPHHSTNPLEKENTQINKGYNFIQKFTEYSPEYKNNLNLIKSYILNNFEKSCDLINNFRLISKENKGLKLILIDDITSIVHPWISEIISRKKNRAKNDEKSKIDSSQNLILIYNQVFQYFLTQISLLQKCYQIPCFITVNLDLLDKIYFEKNSQMIFNAVFPFVRSCFFFQKSEENQIDFEEKKLILNNKTNKIEVSECQQNKQNYDSLIDFKKSSLYKGMQNLKGKKNKFEVNKDWINNIIGNFVEKINDLSKRIIQKENEKNYGNSMTQLSNN